MNYTIQKLKDENLIIFEGITGSNAYGTNTPESDCDIRGVFIQPLDDVLKYGFIEQVSDKKNDIIFYEIGRFIHLVIANNPNILEMLALPEDCILYCDPLFKKIIDNKYHFLSKRVKYTFAGYAIDQIRKARGYNKKMNWEMSKMTRKSVLDFCYIITTGGSKLFKEWLESWNKNAHIPETHEYFGLAAINHTRDLYAMYFDIDGKEKGWGIVSDEKISNDVKLTSIPKGKIPVAYLSFNKDSYSNHCSKYKEYQTWLKERNVNRYKMNKEHGKNYDSKNMCHTYRLLMMANELARGELRVRRNPEEIEKLMKIRHGEYEYEDLLNEAESMIANLDIIYENSHLPEKVNKDFVLEILKKIRKTIYSQN